MIIPVATAGVYAVKIAEVIDAVAMHLVRLRTRYCPKTNVHKISEHAANAVHLIVVSISVVRMQRRTLRGK